MRLLLLLSFVISPPVMAQDGLVQDDDEDEDYFDDDFEDDFEEEEVEEEDLERMEEADEEIDEEGGDDEDLELDFEDLEKDDEDLFEDDEEEEIAEDAIGGPGVDTAAIYRAFADEVKEFPPEEELIQWEKYLEKYFNTLFRARIDERIEVLSSLIYGERIQDESSSYVDAQDREIDISQPIALDSLDPRTRLRVGLEWGFPGYFSLMLDGEAQITREFSAHVALRGHYTGFRVELGGKYALIKSARKNALVTAGLDLHLNTIPKAFVVLRPYLGAAKRFDIGGGLDVVAVAGAEWDTRSLRHWVFTGGAHAYYRASETVGIFLETSIYMQPGVGSGPYAFNLTTLGMRFVPRKVPVHGVVAANVPYFQNYWGYHFGSVHLEADYYPDLDTFPLLQ